MALERTFSIIKPDATRRHLTGAIVKKFERRRLRVVAQKRIHLTKAQAGEFYKVPAERPFYDELCEFMASAPIVAQVLEGENAIAKNREVMGATNPADAAEGTIRAEFAESVGAVGVNVGHSGTIMGVLLDARERRGKSTYHKAKEAFPDADAVYHFRLLGGGVQRVAA